MIKAIIFDCFGVLTADNWREFVASLPENQRSEASELNRQYGAAYLDKSAFLSAIEELTGRLPQDIDMVLDNETTKNTALLNYIAELKPGYKIGLLSNVGSNWIRDQFLTEMEQSLFDEFVFSYEARVAKPDPEIFVMAAERLKVDLEQCIMIDDVEYNCHVAESLGMKSVCYQDFERAKTEIDKILAVDSEG